MDVEEIGKLLIEIATQKRVSDFHIHSNRPLVFREAGLLTAQEDVIITPELLSAFVQHHSDEVKWERFLATGDSDFALEIEGHRFRANAASTMAGQSLVLRVIVSEVPHIDELGLPQAIHDVLEEKAGLVLVTGETGSGKSTSLAAMIDKINRERAENIITIEDPIEFVHAEQHSIITQREIGRHTESFASALRAALRQDPDIILLGELRDYETISLALTAAETGHLVFGTLHTNGAPATINRIIDVYPAEEQGQARAQLSQSLRLVMTQQLLQRAGGGRIGAFEIMVCTPAISNLIRENKIPQIDSIIQTGAQYGMVTMRKYIEQIRAQGLVAK